MDAVTTCYTNGVLFLTLLVYVDILQKLLNTARLPSFKGGFEVLHQASPEAIHWISNIKDL